VGLFRGNQESSLQSAGNPLEPELERLSQLPLPDLAVEVMAKGWGPGGAAPDGETGFVGIAKVFVPDFVRADAASIHRFTQVIGEGVQVLEHAGLVRFTFWGGQADGPYYTVTRRGQTALAQDTVRRLLAYDR